MVLTQAKVILGLICIYEHLKVLLPPTPRVELLELLHV